jgi:Raf kinase inhibitor-like YbhB/YbcL family protein
MTRRALLAFAPILALVALTSCGAGNRATNEANGDAAVENATLAKLSLISDAFRDGQAIPTQFTCDGANQTPAFSWGEPPSGTKSFAFVVDDPDAPSGTFGHWGVFDIPASARSIGGGQQIGAEVSNDFGKPGYGGPCPPKGHGPHRYRFKLFALDVDRLGLSPNAKVADVQGAVEKHIVSRAELTGTYER